MMKRKQKDRCLLVVFLIAALMLRTFYITRVTGPFVYADELGYWGHAANLTGNTWAGVMNSMPWYAFGYSLLLAPIFLLTTDMLVMYRIAIVLNAVLGLCSFGLAYKVIQKMRMNDSGVAETAVLAFAVTSYSSYIFHSYVAWSETLISFLVWVILYEMILLEESPNCQRGILLGVTTGYSYMVHNRMIAVITAVLLTLAILLWKKKMKMRYVLCVVGSMVVVFLIYSGMKSLLVDLLENNVLLKEMGVSAGFGEANTLSEQVAKIGQIVTSYGLRKFMIGVVGQIWQMLSATYLLAVFGLIVCVKKAVEAVNEKENIGLYLFPVASLFLTVLMTSLFFIGYSYDAMDANVRIDTLFYGRYNDVFAGLFILMALLWLTEYMQVRAAYKHICIIGLFYLAVSLIMHYSLDGIENFYLNIVDSAGIYTFHWLGEFSVWKCVLMAFLVSAAYLLCYSVKMPKLMSRYLICLMLVLLFSAAALKCMRFTIRGENDYIRQYTEMYDFLNENAGKKEPVFTLESGKFADDLQTRIVDKPVICIDRDQVDLVTDSGYLVMSEQDYNVLSPQDYVICLQTQGYVVLQKTSYFSRVRNAHLLRIP